MKLSSFVQFLLGPQKSIRVFLTYLTISLTLLIGARFISFSHNLKGWPLFSRIVIKEYAPVDVSMTLSGSRSLGGDLGFIQLLQYYASAGNEKNIDPSDTRTWNPQLLNYSKRIISLNPFHHYTYLFTAGSLAFVLKRPEEAVALLEEGIQHDPSFWRYRLYLGAIAFKEKAEYQKVIVLLEKAMRYPDCPSMIKNILAGIYKSQGNYKRAAEIYLLLLKSRDANYAIKAEENLRELVEKHGIILS